MKKKIRFETIVIKLLLVCFFAVGLAACSEAQQKKTGDKVMEDYQPEYTVTALSSKFETAFKQRSVDSMARVFTDWNKRIQSNSNDYINQSDTIKAVFQVYTAFFKPLDLLKLGDWEWGNKLNANSQYVLVQNSIYFSVITGNDFDTYDSEKSARNSIDNFRPPLHIDKTKVLYLTPEYEQSLNKFLGTQSTQLGKPNIMNLSRSAGESERRYEKIRPFIPVLHGHWGGYWHLATHPDVSVVVFNNTLTKAKIIFRVGYQGGEAVMVKRGDTWMIEKSNATWIE